MNLVVDQGNTKHKYAVFEGEKMLFQESVKKFEVSHLQKLNADFQISAVIFSSVIKNDISLEKTLKQIERHIILNHETPLPITNLYASPETLGSDRLASVVAANFYYPDSNILVVDAGTCIKFDIITSKKEYLGGAISPGLGMRLQAMHNFTARLPLLQALDPKSSETLEITGNTTKNSMLSGAYHGILFETQGVIDHYSVKYPDLKVVFTGGDMQFFELHLKRRIFARPNLVLEGLNTILNFNLNTN